jgi:hypothetical protein
MLSKLPRLFLEEYHDIEATEKECGIEFITYTTSSALFLPSPLKSLDTVVRTSTILHDSRKVAATAVR